MGTLWDWLFRLFAPTEAAGRASDGALRVLVALAFLLLVIGFCWALLAIWNDERP